MPIYLGTDKTKNSWLGTSKVKTVWLGTDKVYSSDNRLFLYKEGDECTTVTGGWTGYTNTYSNAVKESDCLKITSQRSSQNGTFVTNNLLDFSRYTKVCIEYSLDYTQRGAIRICDEKTSDPEPWDYQTELTSGTKASGEHTLVSSELTGTHYMGLTVWGYRNYGTTTVTMRIYNLWLE